MNISPYINYLKIRPLIRLFLGDTYNKELRVLTELMRVSNVTAYSTARQPKVWYLLGEMR